jgi:phospholipid/cholesterol/gamma-HCH transport system permease protein
MGAAAQKLDQGRISFERTNESTLVAHLSGLWHLQRDLPPISLLLAELGSQPGTRRLAYETAQLRHWDSGLISFLTNTAEIRRARGIAEDRAGLPSGLKRLLELAEAVPEKKGARSAAARVSFFERVGNVTIGYGLSVGEFLSFLGDLTLAFAKFFRGKARYRKIDLLEVIQECGPNAVGIVTLISFLVGVILAFMGAVQLSQFGASIYVADLVGIGMVRDMAAMMTAIIMSGRTGAAFAAKLGTMKVTQEIDALTTMGVSPLEFLVLPRVLALVLMMPLLCLFADLVGILGGLFVGVTMLDLSAGSYLRETISTLTLVNLFGGIIKGTFYGVLIAIAGCLRGFQCGNSSSAVGDAATQAVVMAIVMIVVACGLFAVVFNFLGI